jgi:hypothetical protein
MIYSEARGTLIYEKNLKSKISCQTPFKEIVTQDGYLFIRSTFLISVFCERADGF